MALGEKLLEKSKMLDELLPTPPRENLNTHFVLGEIIDQIDLIKDDFPLVQIATLKEHLWDIRNKNVDPEVHLRGFLHVFKNTEVFKDAFEQLDESMKLRIKAFMDGKSEKEVLTAGGKTGGAFVLPPSPPVKHHFRKLLEDLKEDIHELFHPEHKATEGEVVQKLGAEASTKGYPRIFEDVAETKAMEVHGNTDFRNWGKSVSNTPKWTFVPKTILGLQNLVKWAKVNDFRVRCSGYRHSWSSTFSEDKQILVSLLNLEQVTTIPDVMSIAPEYIDPENELKVIQLAAPEGTATTGAEKALVRVGVSVTNEQFRRWAVANDKWTLPVDVILVEVTFGGVNGPICHGAGRRHQTINDYVRAVEYVDANGEHRTISDPAHLKAAAGCFGLLGIVTHITFALDKMSYAIMEPYKPDIGLAIPPLSRNDIPIALRKTFTDAQYAAALVEFKKRAQEDYYSEWFWFTRSQQAWVNTWNATDEKEGAVEYPSPFMTFIQWIEGWLGGVITENPIFQAFPGRWQAAILSTFGMVALPPFEFVGFAQGKTETIKTSMPNALHFRRGIQNSIVRDMEFQIPIPALASDPTQPDYSIVQRAWWDIINLCYEDDDTPMRLTLELRIMGDSNIIMAPQNGNTFGTASIEVISIPDAVTDNEWVPFLQRVADLWMSYRDSHGVLLNVRPHWAKEWESINMRGKPARQYLKEDAYRDAIPLFKETLREIGEGQGWALEDIKKRFSNELWDYMIYS
ncbi:hypothetical protein BKA64DRAFT_701940 [Cadophora sp. MPI-SDFR-AT-0126]|nr:hypothetical protein BKA64DRAFT_701940 [Leotiomycetes sp. MPI-SDFR-AT-0126]